MEAATTNKPTQQLTKTTALIGNPNVGKSSIFNQLTGLGQKIGNYPGVTVDKTVGTVKKDGRKFDLIDLPGIYSLYPKSEDEVIAHRVLNSYGGERPDHVLVVLDACNLERGLLLGTQIMDLGIPLAFVLNMKDLAKKKGIKVNTYQLYKSLGIPLVLTDARNKEGINAIRGLVFGEQFEKSGTFMEAANFAPAPLLKATKEKFSLATDYEAFQLLVFGAYDKALGVAEREWLNTQSKEFGFDAKEQQGAETSARYQKINGLLEKVITRENVPVKNFTQALDRALLHPVFGYLAFLTIMLLVFQAIFAWAEFPMGLIEESFASFGAWVHGLLPAGALTDLLAEGIIPGIGGIVIFIPQIALLFGFLAFLEDTGYLSRAVF